MRFSLYKIIFAIAFNFSSFGMQDQIDMQKEAENFARSIIKENRRFGAIIKEFNKKPDDLKNLIKIELVKQGNRFFLDSLYVRMVTVLDEYCPMDDVALDADGSHALTYSYDGVKLWDLSKSDFTYRMVLNTSGDSIPHGSVALSGNSKFALIGSGKSVSLWNLYEKLEQIRVFEDCISANFLSADGNIALTRSYKEATLWDLANNSESPQMFREDFVGHITEIALSGDCKYALSNSDRGLTLWNLKDFSIHKYILCIPSRDITSLALNEDGSYALIGFIDRLSVFLDLINDYVINGLGIDRTVSVALSLDGRYALTGTTDGAKLWKLSILSNDMSFEELILVINLQKFRLRGKSFDHLNPKLKEVFENSKYKKEIEDYFGFKFTAGKWDYI